MQHDAGTLSTTDGLTLATRRWMPHQHPRAALLIVHGLSEHSGRYSHVAAHLMLRDVAVYSYDHRHHGRSEGRPLAYVERFQTLVEDLDMVLEWVRTDSGDRPLFILGHSLGGAVVTRHIVEHEGEDLAGVILSAPALRFPDSFSPILRKLAPVIERIAPRLPTTKADRAFLSRDPKTYQNWSEDPLTYKGGLRIRTGLELLRNSFDLLDEVDHFTMPLKIMHGTADRSTDIAGSRLLYERAPSEDKTLRVFDDGYHETLNDLEKDTALTEISNWIVERS